MNESQKSFSDFIKSSGFKGTLLFDEPLSKHSTFKIGNTTDIYYEPKDKDAFIKILAFCRSQNIKFHIAGGGSNVVYPDEVFHGAIISTLGINSIEKIENGGDFVLVRLGAGTTMSSFVSFCTQNELSGAEQFAGLPGSIGGALYMNARCFDKSISEIFNSASYIDTDDFTENEIGFMSSDWDYKVSPFQNTGKIVCEAVFTLKKCSGQKTQIEESCKNFINQRVSKGHFKFPSAGSVFKNNRDFGVPSGKLIDECGLKGTRIGGAQIAPFHGNFIINIDNATAKDVKALMEKAVNTVREKKGFSLVPEIIFV